MPNIQQGINQLLGFGAAASLAYQHSPKGKSGKYLREADRLGKEELYEEAQEQYEKAYETYPSAKTSEYITDTEAEEQLAAEKKQQKEYQELYGQQRGIAKGQEKLMNNEKVKLFQSMLIDPKTDKPLIAEAGVLQKGGNKQ